MKKIIIIIGLLVALVSIPVSVSAHGFSFTPKQLEDAQRKYDKWDEMVGDMERAIASLANPTADWSIYFRRDTLAIINNNGVLTQLFIAAKAAFETQRDNVQIP